MGILDILVDMISLVPAVLSTDYFLKFSTPYFMRVLLVFVMGLSVFMSFMAIESRLYRPIGSLRHKYRYLVTFLLSVLLASLTGHKYYIASHNNMPMYEIVLYGTVAVFWAIVALVKLNQSLNVKYETVQEPEKKTKATIGNVQGNSKKKAASDVKKVKSDPKKSRAAVYYKEAMDELNAIIGMDDLKKEVEKFVVNIEMMRKKEAQGIKNDKQTMHMLFVGPPGTGKTTIARIIAKLLYGMGILSKGHCVEARRKDLISGYIGQTAGKTFDVIHSAIGGVLFIDEAYSLNPRPQGFEQEALDTLNQEMEENRKDLVVILAGYEDLMEEFLDANEGFRSRIPYKFHFKPYNKMELYKILTEMISSKGYRLADNAEEELLKQIEILMPYAENSNGRLMRNLLERMELESNYRLKRENARADKLLYLTSEDIQKAAENLLANES